MASVAAINGPMHTLPTTADPMNQRIRSILEIIRTQRGRHVPVSLQLKRRRWRCWVQGCWMVGLVPGRRFKQWRCWVQSSFSVLGSELWEAFSRMTLARSGRRS